MVEGEEGVRNMNREFDFAGLWKVQMGSNTRSLDTSSPVIPTAVVLKCRTYLSDFDILPRKQTMLYTACI